MECLLVVACNETGHGEHVSEGNDHKGPVKGSFEEGFSWLLLGCVLRCRLVLAGEAESIVEIVVEWIDRKRGLESLVSINDVSVSVLLGL